MALQVVSSHQLGALDIEKALSVQELLAKRLLPHAASEAETLKRSNCPRLFLLDGCSLNFPLWPLSGRLRANSPGSKFLALLPPDKSTQSEMTLLFYWGVNGFVTLHKKARPRPMAAMIALDFLVEEGPIRADAVVRHPNPGHGVGLQFATMKHEDRSHLAALLNRLSRSSSPETPAF